MLRTPDISIFGSAHRPQNWMDLYRSIGDNKVSFEIIFVGPDPPDFKLPNNFRFIKSLTKPTQCLEIAARNTKGHLIMNVADDTEFRTKQPLDRLCSTYLLHNDGKIMLSCRYILNGEDLSQSVHRFFVKDENSPIMPLSALMSKRLYESVGGIDRNFIGTMWDLDLAMRVYVLGGRVVLSDVYIEELISKKAGSELCGETWDYDRRLLESLWSTDGKVHLNRSKPFEPFADFQILEVSQGPRGRWRGSSPIMFEKLVDFLWWNSIRKLHRLYFARIFNAIKQPKQYPKYARDVFNTFFKRPLSG